MIDESRKARLAKLRREPPELRRVELTGAEDLSSRLIRLTFSGEGLRGLVVDEPAASVRLLIPPPGAEDLVIPQWDGNEFLLPGGHRPIIRTFTPPFHGADDTSIDLDVVVHEAGVVGAWARSASHGAEAAVSGPGRGYSVDEDAQHYLLAGDETAIPAIRQLLGVLPEQARTTVHVEVAQRDARLDLGERGHVEVTWHDLPEQAPPGETLVEAVSRADIETSTVVWAAGEAAAVHRIRRHLFDEVGLPRSQTAIRGYWKLRE